MTGSSADLEVVQRTAEQVLEPAAQWIQADQPSAVSHQPFFAWVHLYDPHEPYSPPEPYRSRYASDPARRRNRLHRCGAGIISRSAARQRPPRQYTRRGRGRSWRIARRARRADSHGLFAYDATLRVPLIVWAPQKIRAAVISSPARLVDVAPTILDLVGGAPLERVAGRTLRPAIAGEPVDDPGSYFEALPTREPHPQLGAAAASSLVD